MEILAKRLVERFQIFIFCGKIAETRIRRESRHVGQASFERGAVFDGKILDNRSRLAAQLL
jgi:hypothetical protein